MALFMCLLCWSRKQCTCICMLNEWTNSCYVVCDLYGNVQYLLFIVFHCNLALPNKIQQEPWILLPNEQGFILKRFHLVVTEISRATPGILLVFNKSRNIKIYFYKVYFICHFPDPSLCCFYHYHCSRNIIRLLQLCNLALNVIVDS